MSDKIVTKILGYPVGADVNTEGKKLATVEDGAGGGGSTLYRHNVTVKIMDDIGSVTATLKWRFLDGRKEQYTKADFFNIFSTPMVYEFCHITSMSGGIYLGVVEETTMLPDNIKFNPITDFYSSSVFDIYHGSPDYVEVTDDIETL